MTKYRKKPVEIEAIELKRSDANIKGVVQFIEGHSIDTTHSPMALQRWGEYCELVRERGLEIETLEGTMKASIGDYIIKGVQGEFYPCKPDIFHATYEKVED